MSKIEELNEILKDQIQLEGFEEWFIKLLLLEDQSALVRDVLRNQKQNLKEEWLKVKPLEEEKGK